MTTENIDIVVKSAGTRRVVRDLQDIGDAASNAQTRIDNLQRSLGQLAGGQFISQLRSAQQALGALGANSNLGNFLTQLQQVNAQLAQMIQLNSQVRGGVANLGAGHQLGGLRSALQGVIAYLSVKKIMDWSDAWTQAAGKINVFARNQEEANYVMERVFQLSQESRQPLTTMANLYHRLTISASELGASQSQMLRFTELVGKAMAVQGTPITQARGALLQLSQAMGTVKVRAQEFNSLLENAPILLKIVAQNIDGAHGSISKLREIQRAGNLTSQQFFQALLKGGDDLEKLFEKVPKTFGQGVTVLVNAVERYLGKLNEAYGISNKFFDLMKLLGDNLDTVVRTLMAVGIAVGIAFAPALLGTAATMLGSIATAVLGIGAALLATPLGLLTALAGAAYLFADKINIGVDSVTTLKDLFVAAWPVIITLLTESSGLLSGFWSGLGTLIDSLLNSMTAKTVGSTQAWTNAYQQFYADTGTGFAGVVRALAKTADAIGGLILGLGIGIVRVLDGLPEAVSQIGARMRNALYGAIEDILNSTIDGMNRLRAMVGKEALSHIQLARADVDKAYFENYGKSIMGSIDAGFDMQGGMLLNSVNDIFNKAAVEAQKRISALGGGKPPGLDDPLGDGSAGTGGKPKRGRGGIDIAAIREELDKYKQLANEYAEIERHKEVMLKQQYDQGLLTYRQYNDQLTALQNSSFEQRKQLLTTELSTVSGMLEKLPSQLKAKGYEQKEIDNVVKDLTTRLKGLNAELQKLEDKNAERLGAALTRALQPSRELVKNSEKEFAALQLNTQQELEKLEVKSNINLVSERELYIQQELLKLTDKYKDQLDKISRAFEEQKKNGVFDDLTDPAVAKTFNETLQLIQKYQDAISKLKQDAPDILGKAFDASQIAAFAKDLNSSIADAILNGGKNGWKGVREAIKAELKKPLKMVIQAVIQPITSMISQFVMGATQSLIRSITGSASNSLFSNLAGKFTDSMGLTGPGSITDSMLGQFGYGSGIGGSAISSAEVASSISSTSDALLSAGASAEEATAASQALGESLSSTSSAASGAMSALGPFAAILAVFAAAYGDGFFSGEKRTGGTYGYSFDGSQVYNSRTGQYQSAANKGTQFLEGPSGGEGDSAITKAAIDSTVAGINEALKVLGSTATLKQFQAGWETSKSGRGGVFSGGTLSDGRTFGDLGAGSNYEDNKTPFNSPYELWSQLKIGEDPKAVFTEFTTDLKQSALELLQVLAGAGPQIVLKKWTEDGPLPSSGEDTAGLTGPVDKEKWVRIFDDVALAAADAAAVLPKKIWELIRGVDFESKADAEVTAVLTKISTMIANVKGFRQAVEAVPVAELKRLSFDAAAGLVELAGGIETFTKNLSAYVDNFFTDEEKRTQMVRNITSVLNGAGFSFSTQQIALATRAQFRQLAESLDLTTEFGQRAYAALMSVAGAFASITEASSILTPSVDYTGNITAALDNLETARQNEITAVNTTISTMDTAKDKWKDFAKSLREFATSLKLGDLSPLTPGDKYATAKASFRDTYNKAMSGDETAMGQLQNAAQEYLKASQVYNASSSQYLQDFAEVQAAVASAIAKSDSMVSTAEAQLAVQRAQLSSLQGVNSSVITVKNAVDALQKAVVTALQNGVAVSQSVLDTLAQFGININPAQYQNGTGSTSNTYKGTNGQTYTYDAIRSYVNSGVSPREVYDNAKAIGLTMPLLDQIMGWSPGTSAAWAAANSLPAFADGGYASGLSLVGERGPEIVDFRTPGRVYSSDQTREFMRGYGTVDNSVVQLLNRLIEEMSELREEARAAARYQSDSHREAALESAEAIASGVGRVVTRASNVSQQRRAARMPV